jgi:hypothetical protein
MEIGSARAAPASATAQNAATNRPATDSLIRAFIEDASTSIRYRRRIDERRRYAPRNYIDLADYSDFKFDRSLGTTFQSRCF